MLWYLDLAARAGVVVAAYRDEPIGTMSEDPDGSGRFTEVTLRPVVIISPESDPGRAEELHAEAGRFCFIARSVNFPLYHAPVIRSDGAPLLR